MEARTALAELLQWYADVGVDEAIGDAPVDRTQVIEKPATILPMTQADAAPATPAAALPAAGTIEAVKEAEALAGAARSLDDLKSALENFKGLSLKRTATQMVFADGNPQARVMVVGDAPGADDDRSGIPFAGSNGQLLDKMLGAIGLTREENVYVTTILNWRTPGNRTPAPGEIDMSLPFIKRHIALVNPALIIFIGGGAAKILLQTQEPISRLRGRWLAYGDTPAAAIFHPEYLIQSPSQKKVAWEDLQMIQAKLKELSIL
jgi:uracil-DNA glycosylase family 4